MSKGPKVEVIVRCENVDESEEFLKALKLQKAGGVQKMESLESVLRQTQEYSKDQQRRLNECFKSDVKLIDSRSEAWDRYRALEHVIVNTVGAEALLKLQERMIAQHEACCDTRCKLCMDREKAAAEPPEVPPPAPTCLVCGDPEVDNS